MPAGRTPRERFLECRYFDRRLKKGRSYAYVGFHLSRSLYSLQMAIIRVFLSLWLVGRSVLKLASAVVRRLVTGVLAIPGIILPREVSVNVNVSHVLFTGIFHVCTHSKPRYSMSKEGPFAFVCSRRVAWSTSRIIEAALGWFTQYVIYLLHLNKFFPALSLSLAKRWLA